MASMNDPWVFYSTASEGVLQKAHYLIDEIAHE